MLLCVAWIITENNKKHVPPTERTPYILTFTKNIAMVSTIKTEKRIFFETTEKRIYTHIPLPFFRAKIRQFLVAPRGWKRWV